MYSISTNVDTFVSPVAVCNKYSRLSPEHQEHIAGRGLLNDWVVMSCRTTSAEDATRLLGLRYTAKSGGIMLWGQNGQYQFRPDTPWASEEGKKPPKYRTAKGKPYDALLPGNVNEFDYWEPDRLKEVCWKVNEHPCILLTEGGFTAIAGCSNGIPTIAFLGTTLSLTATDSDPEGKGKRYLLPTVKKYAEAGFGFIIAFDADATTNPNIYKAEEALALALKEYNVPVYTVTGHWNVEDGKGMDDFIQNKGVEEFRKILEKAAAFGERKQSDRTSKKLPTPRETAARLAEQYGHQWKYDDEQKTWRIYSGKHWEKVGIGAFTSLVKTTLDAKNINYPGSAYIEDTRKLLELDLRQIRWQHWDRRRYTNFSNCVLDGDKLTTLEHSPGTGFTSFLPFDYKPLEGDLSDALDALRVNCPSIHKFFRTAMQDDERKMFKLLAIANAILKHRFFDLQMFVHLVGAPGSGKGTFARLVEKMVGRENFKGCQLDRLSDGSTKASVVDKQLVVFADERKPVGIDSILSFTGGGAVSYRELHTPAADAFFYGCFLICSNKPIFVGDTTGLERRLCLVHFDNPIPTEKRDHAIESEFEVEIPALIGIALLLENSAVKSAIQGVGVERIAEFKHKEWEMKVETSSTAAFFDMELVLDTTAVTRTGKLYDAYKYFCEESGFSKVSIVKFPKLLADLLTDERLPFTRHQGAQAYFEGVRLRENSDNYPTHSETLTTFEGVSEGVAGSLEGVGEGVAPLRDITLRELREFDTKVLTRNENEENYLPDEEESDREVDLPPSTPSTPSNVVPVGDTTPYITPSQVPSTPPVTPSAILPQSHANKHRANKLADEMREAIAKGSREDAGEVINRVAASDIQVRGFFAKAFSKEENVNIRLLKHCGLTKGALVKYAGKETEQYEGEVLTVEDINPQNELACLRPDGKGYTTWLKSENLSKL